MKRYFSPLILIFFFYITFFSCSNRPNRSRKPVSSITILPTAKNYIYGQTVTIRVKTKIKNGEIDNIKLYYKDEPIHESNRLDFTVEDIKIDLTGKNIFKVIASKTDGVSNSRVLTFNVVSDIKPEKFSYTILNNYTHNKNFYTQGLEFYNDYLYEGTGEKGASGIFKIDLKTGKIIKKHLINEKYFGEGITILNNKIYQLTYQAQKGFIYNLNDFALIDSFRYNSKEGWGLTNDGKYLIMSNGTHELIWIDPSDFSEIKKIQVVNNEGIVTYLNELEYINDKIYSNVYTTNLIVIIDPGTGKILSEINLEGILNMYSVQSDTIDYLNGIAYDSESDRLFITGKWWPYLFEIKKVPLE